MDKKEYTVLIRQKQDQINKLNKEITKLKVERNKAEPDFTGKYYRGPSCVRWFMSDTVLFEVGEGSGGIFARQTKTEKYHKNLAMDEITSEDFWNEVYEYKKKFNALLGSHGGSIH